MAAPTRQPSFRDRLHGIGLSWHTKSASVDSHGYVNPLDVPVAASDPSPLSPSTTGNPVEGAITPQQEQRTPDHEEASPTAEKKPLSRTNTQPQNTTEYTVSASDTLAGIAARFDTTPSELVKLNRLVSRLIFPGQTLYVPCKSDQNISDTESSNQSPRSPTDKSMSPKPGHVERVQSPVHSFFGSKSLGSSSEERDSSKQDSSRHDSESESKPLGPPVIVHEEKCPERFLKINSKHITDGQGFVSGVLLVTPNGLMFDPNVSDTLVLEHGVETYGVIAPMDMIIRAAIYFDIAHMRVKNSQENLQPNNSKPKIYLGPGSSPVPPTLEETPSFWPVITEDIPDLIQFDNQEVRVPPPPTLEVNVSQHSDTQRSDSVEVMISTPPADEGLTPTTKDPPERLGGLPQSESDMMITSTLAGEENEDDTVEKLGRSATVREGSRNTQSRRERMLKRLSYPVESLSSYTQSSISKILSSPRNLVDFSGFGGRCSNEEVREDSELVQIEPTVPEVQLVNVGYKNMVEGKPDIFAQVDKLLPRPARQYESQPLYLCLRMGKPISKKIQWSTPIASYSKKRMKKEYWFSIPRARVDDLYEFFNHWCPDVYGDVDEVNPADHGFEPISSDPEEDEPTESEALKEKDETDGQKQTRNRGPLSFLKLVEGHFAADGSSSPFDWELVSMSEAEKSPEIELPLPDLSDPSEIFLEDHRKELCKNLPARAEGYPWSLIYSTSKHGFSLKTMYREMAKFETPVLLAITDTQGTVFGAVISCSLKISDHFYGTGESFLFTFHPNFKCYHWTGENMYFIKGNAESLAIGAGDGTFGIWLDGDLYHGRSNCCKTFGNKDPLSSEEDFVVKALEAWGFF